MGHWPNGSTRHWRDVIRPAVLKRDGYTCQLQIPEVCIGTATHVHHTQDRDQVGDDPSLPSISKAGTDCISKSRSNHLYMAREFGIVFIGFNGGLYCPTILVS